MRYFLLILIFLNSGSLFAQQKERIEYSVYSDTIESNRIDKAVGKALFDFVKNRIDFISFDDNENCDLRAHVICFILEKKFDNLKVGKAWLFGDSKRASKKKIYKDGSVSGLSMKSKGVNWGYHVAPVIILEKDTIVLDPTTQASSVPIRKWAKDLIPYGSKGYLVLKDNDIFCFPSDEDNKFLDNSPNWDNEFSENTETDLYTEIAEKISSAYNGILDPSKIVYYKNKLFNLCSE